MQATLTAPQKQDAVFVVVNAVAVVVSAFAAGCGGVGTAVSACAVGYVGVGTDVAGFGATGSGELAAHPIEMMGMCRFS